MMVALLVMAGSALGGLGRYLTGLGLRSVCGEAFPYWTLAVNVIGSFLIVFIAAMTDDERLRAFILIGLLGGFTTFSSFSMETLDKLLQDQVLLGLINIFASVLLCLLAAYLGHLAGKGFATS